MFARLWWLLVGAFALLVVDERYLGDKALWGFSPNDRLEVLTLGAFLFAVGIVVYRWLRTANDRTPEPTVRGALPRAPLRSTVTAWIVSILGLLLAMFLISYAGAQIDDPELRLGVTTVLTVPLYVGGTVIACWRLSARSRGLAYILTRAGLFAAFCSFLVQVIFDLPAASLAGGQSARFQLRGDLVTFGVVSGALSTVVLRLVAMKLAARR